MKAKRSTHDEDMDRLGKAWPLRVLQLIGLWQPSSIPKVCSLASCPPSGHIVGVLFGSIDCSSVVYDLGNLLFWRDFWPCCGHRFGKPVCSLNPSVTGFENLLYFLLCILLPYKLGKRSDTYVSNTIDFVLKTKVL
jgi:hypothetical protein